MPSDPAGQRAGTGRPRARNANRHVRARLRGRRVMLGPGRRRLAALTGTTCQQAHKYEIGANRTSTGRPHALARALGVEPGSSFEALDEDAPGRPRLR